MENAKYIPGDLVTTNGRPLGTKEGVVYQVIGSDPSYTITLDNGNTLRGKVELDNFEITKISEEGYLFVTVGAWEKDIISIPLTPSILEANGWTKCNRLLGEDGGSQDYFKKYNDTLILYICKDEDGIEYFCPNIDVGVDVYYVHELQHLLFGLGLPSELKI